MSTIERAMRKLDGEDLSQDRLRADEADVETSATENAVVAQAVESPVDTQTQEPEAAESTATPSTIELEPAEPAPRTRTAKLDFESLATRGFLVPGEKSNVRLSEEYQTIKRRLIANTVPGVLDCEAPNLVMVTSSLPSEGKTYTSLNLALSLSEEVERNVLLIDVDIAKSDMSRLFGVVNRTGLFDVLANPDLGLEDVIMTTNVPSLSLVPAGTIRERITENIASSSMAALSREVATRYPDRVVIFDCPPILATSSANALAPLVGQIVLVVESCQTTQQTLNHALSMMGDTPITGLVLNKIRHRGVSNSGYYGYGYNRYGYGYGYGYGRED